MAAEEATAFDNHVPANEYSNTLFLESFSKNIKDLWANIDSYINKEAYEQMINKLFEIIEHKMNGTFHEVIFKYAFMVDG